MENMRIYEKVRAVPENAKKKITGGRLNGKTDINPMWRIKALTELFGPCGIGWYYKTVNKWLEAAGDEIAAFVDIELYIRVDGEWSMPIPGTGGSMFAEQERGGIHVSDECYKMATTDAISVACKQLGIGADVYWGSDTGKYTAPGWQQPAGNEPEEKQAEKRKEPELTPQEKERQRIMAEILTECKRTGHGNNTAKKLYRGKTVEQLSVLQLKDFLRKLKGFPDQDKAVG